MHTDLTATASDNYKEKTNYYICGERTPRFNSRCFNFSLSFFFLFTIFEFYLHPNKKVRGIRDCLFSRAWIYNHRLLFSQESVHLQLARVFDDSKTRLSLGLPRLSFEFWILPSVTRQTTATLARLPWKLLHNRVNYPQGSFCHFTAITHVVLVIL